MSEIVAYRIKDYADGWILQESLTDSERAIYAEQGNVVQALVPADRITTLEKENAELRRAVEFVKLWAWRESPMTDAERLSAIKWHPSIQPAKTMEDIHREQLARPRIKPSEAEGREG